MHTPLRPNAEEPPHNGTARDGFSVRMVNDLVKDLGEPRPWIHVSGVRSRKRKKNTGGNQKTRVIM